MGCLAEGLSRKEKQNCGFRSVKDVGKGSSIEVATYSDLSGAIGNRDSACIS